ncbi:sensory box protein : PAS domain S-box OS=Thiocystis violascens (strain ATCC 17096 / DSM 198 / 6111) GN=Thivi_3000 PE=4 SV=1: MASE1: PAS_4: PAS_4: PAS_3: PAS_3: PAS_3: PAS_3: PAS_3: PAS_4: HisKA: HATPase_c: Response_reg [Gemmataceae bacterium]|nr:sensory box protein : PAS domain S-box OS=Thiocystis violascens (strain ATCC 17096 / DSM 198 / 6111) GN=Thivi_3000 PE=4 SV=1: MASE1: PAS_4: PAS_4: PAS_3: PAS_3: PAS_3: PAS_3: PAS_3: PAS_4: HisKA: HATPase_c: Response_reg [Gemmataceae bacterium]VTT96339.1 sensory box protein : PAS domain S-box OS=Thiocystis violascens (strain ATCC 17096 / DSM 198 / 6111) GN=Thivi_3000 PE=4 SV=1: MASE1: PAS_4: PAS_4: PAS_3: PAS_3: PAS_3: PAS_3: PAS_3: PAS_4: HisKA: HATPase_c: Response_reg [Gemmataceae bacterium]
MATGLRGQLDASQTVRHLPIGVTFAVVALAYLIGAEVGHWLSAEPGHFATFWPNSGLYLALLLRMPHRRWWVVVTAVVAANLTSDVLLHGQRPLVALGFVLANTVEAVVGAVAVRHWLGGSARLDGLRSVLVVFLVAAAVSTPLGGLVGAATVSSAFGSPLLGVWQVWWVADALGVLLTVPLVLSLLDVRAWPRPARLLEGAVLLASLVAAGVFVFTSTPHIAPIVLLLFLLWAAIRLDVTGVAVAAFVLAVVAVRYTVLGYGIFTETGDISQRVVSVQLFVAVPAVVFYAFAVVLAERRRAEAGLEEKVRERTAALVAQRELLSVTLTSIGDAVITTDTAGRVTNLNPVAESLTGWTTAEASGQPLDAVFNIVNETTRKAVDNPAFRALKLGVIVGLANHTVLIAKDGVERPIEDSAAPIRSKDGEIVGCVLVFRDVTERRRAEAEQETAQRQVATTLESITDGFMRFDKDWRIVYMNAEAERINQRPRGELLGQSHWELFPATVGTKLEAEYRRAMADRVTIEIENHYEPWGRWFSIKGFPTPDGGLAIYFNDITARKQADESRRRVEERFRLAADAVNGVIYEYDFATGHVERSRGVYEVLGHRPDEVPPTAGWWAEQIHPDDRPRVTAIDPGAVTAGSTLAEYRVRHKDGRWLHVEDRAVLVAGGDGRPVRMVGCTVDVSDRKEAERRVRESEHRLRLAMEAAATGLWEWDVTTNAVTWSPECYPIHGLRDGEFDGTAAGFDRLLHPDDRDRVWATVRAAVDDRTKYECEFRVVRPDGDVRWVANVGRAVGDEQGRPVRMVGTLTDITERKQTEQQLRESEERLRMALTAARAGAWAWDVPTGRIDWSPENYALYGYDPAGGPPAYADWERRVHPDDREGTNAAVRAALDRRADGFRAEFRVVHPTHGVRWLVGLGQVEFGPAGEAVRMAGINLDITDRKEAEERVRAGEGRLRLALTAARMVVWEWTPGDGKLRVSENAADVFGLPAGVGLTGIDQGIALLHPDDVAAYRATFQKAIDGRDSYLTHYRLVRPNDGRVIWVEERGHTVFDQPGGAVRLYGVATDVTARRDAEEGQRVSETFARQVSDVAPSILYVYDLNERRNVWANRETFGGLGYSREQLDAMSGHLLTTLLHPDDLAGYEAHAARLHALADGEVAEFEYRLRAADGDYRWMVSRDMPFRRHAGRVTQIIGAALDITARKRSEEEAETSRRTLHALVEQCPFGIYIVDADFRIASVNAGSVDKAFVNVRPLIGRPFEEAMRIIWPEPVATEVLAVFRRTLATGEAYRSADFVNPRADIGQTEGYEWELHRLTLPDGRYGVVCYYYDSTRLRLAQQALQDADRKKDEFLATLAHELRNPLAPIQNGVQIIKMSEPNGAVGKTLDTMDRQLGHLVRLIDDLLDVSRITRGKLHLQRERVAVSAVIDAAVEATMPLVARNRHELTVRPVPDVWLDGDPTRLAQIISNLLTNAAKYTQRGGRITLTAKADGGEVVVSVKDTGIGIPPSMLNRVFEMFSQVDRALEKTTGGLGIGLSLVKGLVEMHGGTISAHSEGEGQGSEFTVRLPAIAGTGEGRTMNGTALMATGRKLTILVVDDNEDAAESMATMLEMFGHEVRTAFDGEAGVAAAGEFRPQVAFLDIGMPKVNGYDAARRIRAEGWGKDMLLVALTGWGSDDDKRRTEEAGFDRHLTKPVNPQALTKLLAEVEPVGA